MTSLAFKIIRIIGFVLLSFGSASLTYAEPMRALALADRDQWHAIGRVNSGGFRIRGGCTGTLIAPDLVLTAAHCVSGDQTPGVTHFIAGWDRSTFAANRVSARVKIHPSYNPDDHKRRFRYDIAVVELGEPIPGSVISPIPLLAQAANVPQHAMLLGYRNDTPHVLHAHDGCPKVSPPGVTPWQYGCEVVSGNSGGPVVVDTSTGPAVVGVMVGRTHGDGDAVVTPIGVWVALQWRKALERHGAAK